MKYNMWHMKYEVMTEKTHHDIIVPRDIYIEWNGLEKITFSRKASLYKCYDFGR